MKIKTALCLAPIVSAVLASQAMAQSPADQPPSPWYFGFALTRSDATIEPASLSALSGGATVGDVDDRFNGFQIYLGYEFNRYLAIEAGGGRLGTTSAAYSNGQIVEYRMSVLFADAVGMWPLGEKWRLVGRVGATVGETRIGLENSVLVLSTDQKDETDVNFKFGGGAQYYLTPDIGWRVEYSRYKMPDPASRDDVKVDNLAASLFFRF